MSPIGRVNLHFLEILKKRAAQKHSSNIDINIRWRLKIQRLRLSKFSKLEFTAVTEYFENFEERKDLDF